MGSVSKQSRCGRWQAMGRVLASIACAALISVNAMPLKGKNSHHDKATRKLQLLSRKLKPLHAEMGPLQSGDWLESHRERGQTFQQYLRSRPVTITDTRKVLYVLPLGEFGEEQRKIIDLSAEFLGIYYGCAVKTMETLPLDDVVPASARRVHPSWGVRQIQSVYVLNEVLPERLPADAVALIAFTSSDLYPDENWNFVFGQASLRNRVGVWSIFRNGDPQLEFKTCLLRTIRVATHETGHMFSIAHCTAYECNMCGSNSLSESDRRPIHLCPECVAKVWWATRCDPESRFTELAEFCRRNGLDDQADFFSDSLDRIK